MDEPVDAAQIHECSELCQPHDHAFADLSDLERAEQLLFLRVQLLFQNQTLRENYAMPFVVEIDDLEAQLLPISSSRLPTG